MTLTCTTVHTCASREIRTMVDGIIQYKQSHKCSQHKMLYECKTTQNFLLNKCNPWIRFKFNFDELLFFNTTVQTSDSQARRHGLHKITVSHVEINIIANTNNAQGEIVKQAELIDR